MARYSNAALIETFFANRGAVEGYANSMRIVDNSLFSYELKIAKFSGNVLYVLHNPTTTVTTKQHLGLVLWYSWRRSLSPLVLLPPITDSGTTLHMAYVPYIGADTNATATYFQGLLDRIEQRWSRSRNANTLAEYFRILNDARHVMPLLFIKSNMAMIYKLNGGEIDFTAAQLR
jgi:hypothetical protein